MSLLIVKATGRTSNLTFEADLLGVQHLWKTRYNAHGLITFFVKPRAEEKKKPGALAKLFSPHPMTDSVAGDCRLSALPVADQARGTYRPIYGSRGEMNGMRNASRPSEDT